jgi:hypothetical protein
MDITMDSAGSLHRTWTPVAGEARDGRVARLRAGTSRSLAAAAERRSRRSATQSVMYRREALRLRHEAESFEAVARSFERSRFAADPQPVAGPTVT